MGDIGGLTKSGGTRATDQEADDPAYLPGRSTGMARVREDREAAAAQIGRTMRVWRKGSGGAGQAAVPTSGGLPLPAAVRQQMEPRLGADLSGVKVHNSGESAQAANKFGARAFTVGSDVHFNSGEFSPGSKEGDRLLAHELTHVVQGQRSGVQRSTEPGAEEAGAEGAGGGAEVSSPGEPAEVEADAKGDEVAEDIHDGGKEEKGDKGGGAGGAGKAAKQAALEGGGGGGGGGEAAAAESGDAAPAAAEAPAEAPVAAKLHRKIFLKKKDLDPKKAKEKEEELAKKKEMCLKKVELAAAQGEQTQKALDIVASLGVDAILALAGPAAPLLAPIIKTVVGLSSDGINLSLDAKREVDAAVLSRTIATMSSRQIKNLANKWTNVEPALSKMEGDVQGQLELIKAAGLGGSAKEGAAKLAKGAAQEGAKKVVEHFLEFIPFIGQAMKIAELVKVTLEISSLREEIEKLQDELA